MRQLGAFVLGVLMALSIGTPAWAEGSGASRSTVLIVDTSGSMRGAKLEATRTAVSSYVARLPEDVDVGIVAFSTTPRVVLRPTADRQAVERAVASLRAQGGTSLYDAVLAGVRLASTAGSSRMVVVTDGNDSKSRATLAAVTRRLTTAGIPLDAVEVRPGQQPSPALRKLAEAGGGRVVSVSNASQLSASLAALPKVSDPSPSPSPHQATDPLAGWQPGHALRIILGLCFAGLLALLALVFLAVGGKDRRRRRGHAIVESYGAGATVEQGTSGSLYERSPVLGAALSVASRVAASDRIGDRIGVLLARAGLGIRPAEWLLMLFGVALGGIVLIGLLSGSLLLGLVLGALLGLAAGHGWLLVKAQRRARAFEERLPDALQLLAGGLASGFAFAQAVDSVAQRGPEPVAVEFGRALSEARLGAQLEDALDRVAVRMDSRDLQLTVMSIRIQREVGGNLAEVLRTTVGTMRERAYLRRQVRTLGAEGRLSAYILTGLPICIAAFLAVARGDYLRPLYTDPIGILLVVAATVSIVIGALFMRKVIQVEV